MQYEHQGRDEGSLTSYARNQILKFKINYVSYLLQNNTLHVLRITEYK